MKLLSVAIPCYNSEAYMSKCINSLLIAGEEVEIIIVDDGSSDRTAEIADDYAEKYPTIVKVIHQENGGHGQAVNTGIKNATGLYFKVVDSDDWVNQDAYYEVLKTLYELTRGAETVDLLISNFVYEKQGATRKKVMQYRHCFPTNQIFGWDEVRHMKKGQYLLMHSMIYRTKLLHDCGMELPKHTFYVDNLFAFEPLPYVKNLYYLDVNFYRYFIGRDDQSVNEKVMIKRIDQQIRVNKLMVDAYLKANVSNRRLRAYMFSYLDIITTVSSIMLVRAATQECLDKKQELQDYIKDQNMGLYRKLRRSLFGRVSNLPGRGGRKMFVAAYKICQKFYGLIKKPPTGLFFINSVPASSYAYGIGSAVPRSHPLSVDRTGDGRTVPVWYQGIHRSQNAA